MTGFSQTPKGVSYPLPDERYKVDILLIVAHPDDETAVGGYLAKTIFDENKQVAVIYTNRGGGGGNMIGNEQSSSMAAIREIEARKATAAFGIDLIWFLDGKDTPSQDIFASLSRWGHGQILEEVIRLIRLTRPEVIITWLPNYVAGENHGDHQAAGVIATEAFDLAGNPIVFPTQVTPPREPKDVNNVTEGLLPWQAKKLYFFSDRSRPIQAEGPSFDIREMSPSQKVPYYKLASRLHLPHLTQGEVSEIASKAISTDDFTDFIQWMSTFKLIFGKSVVPCRPDGDIFEGITHTPHLYVPTRGYRYLKDESVILELGGVFDFYREFWKAHEIEHIGSLVEPEVTIAYRNFLHVPLLLFNGTNDSVIVEVKARYPQGWHEVASTDSYHLAPGQNVPIQAFFFAPEQTSEKEHVLRWDARLDGNIIGTVKFRVFLNEWTLPQ